MRPIRCGTSQQNERRGILSPKAAHQALAVTVGRTNPLTTLDGEKVFLAHHENIVIAIEMGDLKFRTEDGETHHAVVGKGFAQVINNRVTVLVDSAERPEDIDKIRAEEALERAKEQMRQKQSIQEYYHSQASMARAMTRLKLSSRYLK